jgi:hypothetical protein
VYNRGQPDVPDKRAHRGQDPRDAEAFSPPKLLALRGAVADFSWLLGRGYTAVSALKLVGDRWWLTARQRQAVRRAACSDDARERRLAHRVAPDRVACNELMIDGFNVLTTIEAALGGAVVIVCRDTTCRDIAGIHSGYRKVAETEPALETLIAVLTKLNVGRCRWLFDRPVSNSGRIRNLVLRAAVERTLDWSVDLVANPDPILSSSGEIVATADSAILDGGPQWINLARLTIEMACPGAMVVDLSCYS